MLGVFLYFSNCVHKMKIIHINSVEIRNAYELCTKALV